METVDFISEERLQTFEKFTDRREKAIALHGHTLQLGSSLMAFIAQLELGLRNSSNRQLAHDYKDGEWLLPDRSSVPLKHREESAKSKAVSYARQAAYSKLGHKEKIWLDAFAFPGGVPTNMRHRRIVAQRQELFVVSHGQVISQTTLSFWKRLYSSDYDATLWRTSLRKVFPNKGLKRSDVSRALEVVYASRNRVAHHEPVYGDRLAKTVEAITFLRDSLGARKGESGTSFQKFTRIQYLRLRMDYESFLEAWATLT